MNPLFQKIIDAKATHGGNHIRDGIYIFTILSMTLEAKQGGNMFIVEFHVDESESYPDISDDKTGKPVLANAAGTTCSWVLNLDKNQSAGGNIKQFVMALLDETQESVDTEEMPVISRFD